MLARRHLSCPPVFAFQGSMDNIETGRKEVKKIPKQEYTAEFKEQAVKHAQAVGIVVAAKELGLVEQTLRNWVKAPAASRLTAPGAKPVTPEQMELSRPRAENARLKMHVDIQKRTAYFAKDAL